MILRSAYAPLLSSAQRLSLYTNSLTLQQCPQPVRQNAPLLLELPKQPPASAYVHLPFCRKRCHYCDFPIIALGSSSSHDDDPRISSYVDTLCREIIATKLPSISSFPPLETVFLGGGTPSLVPPRLVSSVLDALSDKFGLCGDAEISMEMDPGTFNAATMRELMSFGVNRVSLGVQSFQAELLRSCGRAHGVDEIFEAVEIVKACGVENWSVDLISSLPHQTPAMWEESLQLTVAAGPTHVSVYDLQVEQDTKFGVLYTPGEFPLPSENQSADFYKMASAMLGNAGYEHYEISSYCKSGYRCKHNSTYWKNKPFYAFGLGSASHISGVRFSRPRRLKDYVNYVQDLENGAVDTRSDGIVENKDLAMDVTMLSLRTSDGLDLKSFREAFGDSILVSMLEVYRPYLKSGLVICLDEQRRDVAADEVVVSSSLNEKLAYLCLSDPDGFLLSNELIALAFGVISP
ncbi:hypothetical protein SASPL_153797 [Salvia splendens]|uniref:Radical S-adenosyl methionine domain-containing protein 1, mitochondrial n=1 Tax=Salvia splendens TaxID=180675 RepID=A0A8X8YYP0_SALSN|nr:heme chaperone HemW-like [Salvia splendens]KAG6384974.1 hypothetical protein SASPL_153797 [Salvia splendens]